MHKFIIIGMLLAIASCTYSADRKSEVSCEVVQSILEDTSLRQAIGTDQPRIGHRAIRVFWVDHDLISEEPEIFCHGQVDDWYYTTLAGLRPSMNTGYYHDIVLRNMLDSDDPIVEVFVTLEVDSTGEQITFVGHYLVSELGENLSVTLTNGYQYRDRIEVHPSIYEQISDEGL